MEIKTLLNTISITLQDNRERVYNKLSNEKGSATLLLNKGKRPIIQDVKGKTKDIILLKNKFKIISKNLKVKFY